MFTLNLKCVFFLLQFVCWIFSEGQIDGLCGKNDVSSQFYIVVQFYIVLQFYIVVHFYRPSVTGYILFLQILLGITFSSVGNVRTVSTCKEPILYLVLKM